MALDVIYSRRAGFLSGSAAGRVLELLESLGFDLFAGELLHSNAAGKPAVLDGLDEFREHLGGRLAITLLREIGENFEVSEVQTSRVMEAIAELQLRQAS